ncbi:MAG: tetratricopeptide repeat protein [Verrucomicrobia bacterium]|nr:tetratricopeptide repeat protein [Verrucomicrobiota bacterium]
MSLLFKIYTILKGHPPPELPEEWSWPSGMRKFGFWAPLGCLIAAGFLYLFFPDWAEAPRHKYLNPSPYWDMLLWGAGGSAGIALFVFLQNKRWLDVLYLLFSYVGFGLWIAAYVVAPRGGRIALVLTGALAVSGWGVFTGTRRLRRTRDARARVNTASELLRQGQTRKALALLDVAVRNDERNALGWLTRGLVLAQTGRDEEAIANLTSAIELEPHLLLALKTRGVLHAREGRHQAAAADFSSALIEHPDDGDLYVHRAEAFIALEAYDRAWGDAKRADKRGHPEAPHLLQKLRHLAPGYESRGQV